MKIHPFLFIVVLFFSTHSYAKLSIVSGHNVEMPLVVDVSDAVVDDESWLGVFDRSNNDLIAWEYTDTQDSGKVNVSAGKILKPLMAGTVYSLRLYLSENYKPLESLTFTTADQTAFSMDAENITLTTHSEISLNLENVPAGERNWLGLYHSRFDDDRDYVYWCYLPNATDGVFNTGVYPSRSGAYNVRVFMNNGYVDQIAESEVVVNEPPSLPMALAEAVVDRGQSVEVVLPSNLPGTRNWVGVYQAGEQDHKQYLYWRYTHYSINRRLSLSPNLDNGNYEVRLFRNNGYKLESTTQLTVVDPNTTTTTVAMLNGGLQWIEPQVFEALEVAERPTETIENVKIRLKHKVHAAIDVNSGEALAFSRIGDGYEILVPRVNYSKVIEIHHQQFADASATPSSGSLPFWSRINLINGYTGLGAGHFYRPDLHGDAFWFAENALQKLGLRKITRQAKGSAGYFSTLWPTQSIVDATGENPFRLLPDAVAIFTENAQQENLDVIAYYKDFGDVVVAKTHPEWECKTPEGELTSTRDIMMDFSSPWREVVKLQLQELVSRGAKAFYFDVIHMPTWGCYGTNLQQSFLDQTGLEVPKRNLQGHHWHRHENWPSYMEFQNQAVARAFDYWKSAVEEISSEVVFIVSTTYLSGLTSPAHSFELANSADMVKVEFEHGRRGGLRHQVFRNDRNDDHNLAKPSDDILTILAHTLPRDLSIGQKFHSWAYGFANSDQLKGFISAALSMGGVPDVFVPEQYLRSDFDDSSYTPQFASQTQYSDLLEGIAHGQKIATAFELKQPMKYAGVYFDEALRNSFGADFEAAWRDALWPSVGVYDSLLRSGVPVVVLNEETFDRYRSEVSVVFIPTQLENVSEEMKLKLADYISYGGKVIEHNAAHVWDDPDSNALVYRAFSESIQDIIADSPISVVHDSAVSDAEPLYSFFYTR